MRRGLRGRRAAAVPPASLAEPLAAVLPGLAAGAAAMLWSLVAPPWIVVAREPLRRRFPVTAFLVCLALVLNGAVIAALFGIVWFAL